MKTLKTIVSISCLFLFNCEDIIECVINKRPEIPNKTFAVGYINHFYTDDFKSEIKNEPQDNDYDYYYQIYGDLPEGLEFYTDYRTVIIEGTPLEQGTFNFTIYLDVDPPEYYDEESGQYEDSLCSASTSKEFSIIINWYC